jgi:hypothetical protein
MTHSILLASLVSIVLPTLVSPPPSSTQEAKLEFPQASPAGSFKQRVGLTDIEVEYSRPGMKSRKVFGGLVPYGEVWRTGANTATKLSFSGDVKVEGTAVPAGAYALYTIPGEKEWTVILGKVTGQWGAYQYDEKNDQLRVKVKPTALQAPVETMTISVDDVQNGSAMLAITWDKTRVPVKIETDLVASMMPKIKAAMAADGKKPYFQSAMFYFENGQDLKQALAWMDEAVKEQPDAVWIVYRRGLVQEKMGDKKAALASGQAALEMAKKAGGPAGTEYTHLSQALIARVQ